MDFNERFIHFFQKTLAQIEKELNLSNSYIANFRDGKIKKPKKLVFALKNRGLNPDYFLYGEGEPEDKPGSETEQPGGRLVPFLDQAASAGGGKELLDGSVSWYIYLPRITDHAELRAIRVSGDSMTPTLHDGDVVICELSGWNGDGIYVIRTHEFAFVKRIVLQPDGFRVISDNKNYPPYTIRDGEETMLVGKVRFAISKM